MLKLARQDAQNKGKPDPVKTAQYRGITVHTGGGEKDPAYAIVSGRLAVSNSVKNLERLIDRAVSRSSRCPPLRESVPRRSTGMEIAARSSRPGYSGFGFRESRSAPSNRPEAVHAADKPDTGAIFLFGSWLEAIKKAPSLAASIRWSTNELGAISGATGAQRRTTGHSQGLCAGTGEGDRTLDSTARHDRLTQPLARLGHDLGVTGRLVFTRGRPGFCPTGYGRGTVLRSPGVRAGRFGRIGPHWRLVVARQDDASLKLKPDVKLPAFAMIADLNEADGEFPQRLKAAYQTFVGLSNIDAAQKKAQPLELGSEEVLGVTLATSRYMTPRGGCPHRVRQSTRVTTSAPRRLRWVTSSS